MRGPNEAVGAASVPLDIVDAWWRAANYLSVGQIYLMRNPLLDAPLEPDDIKPRLLGHWGTSPGLNLVYAHLNRAIVERGTPTLYVCGPGHGGPAMVANTWLDGTYSELFPAITADREGMERLFRQFSFPGGIPSHAAPETPGSINEGGELGYSLMHAYGAALDNPGLVVACVIGDGEAETGPLAASWRAHTFLNPVTDGAVLPILHLNGFKIANPTLLARIPESELVEFLRGNGYEPLLVTGGFDGEDPMCVHARMADAIDVAYDRIADIRADAAAGAFDREAPRWPAIVLRTPKGWTGPRVVDGVQVEGTFHSHQVPLAEVRENAEHLAMLEQWLRSYRPDELFDGDGRPVAELDALRPVGDLRMSATPVANGGLLRALELPGDRVVRARCRPRRPGHDRTGDVDVRRLVRRAHAGEPRRRAPVRPRRGALEPVGRGVRRDLARLGGAAASARRAPVAVGTRHRGAQRDAHAGHARGVPPHRAPRADHELRGVHPHRRLDVQPAREVARVGERRCRGAATWPRSTTCSRRTCGGRTTTASRTRTRASSTSWSTSRPISCACTCHPTRTPCSRSCGTCSTRRTA